LEVLTCTIPPLVAAQFPGTRTPFRSIGLALLLFAIAVPANAQTATAAPHPETRRILWHKYINQEYGFSFWYPDTYKPIPLPPPDNGEKYRYYQYEEKRLLLLQRRDNPEAKIRITIDIRPFNLHVLAQTHSPTGYDPDWIPLAHRIGTHDFYFYGAGSGGVEYPDQHFVNVKGKTLEFVFDGPDRGKSPSEETSKLEQEILRSLRVI
jgi:hypothetical protein